MTTPRHDRRFAPTLGGPALEPRRLLSDASGAVIALVPPPPPPPPPPPVDPSGPSGPA